MKERPGDESERVVKRKRLLFSVVILFLLSLFLSGCFLGHSAWWKEEVLLHDGQTIIVDRTEKDDPTGLAEPFKGPPRAEETIHFTIPGTKQWVEWKSDFGRDLQDNLTLLLLDFQQGTPYIATKPRFCHAYDKWGRPNPPYVFFKYDGKTWQRIKLEEFPAAFQNTNVLIGGYSKARFTDAELSSPYLTAETVKRQINQMPPSSDYLKRIARKRLSAREASEVGCPFEIYDGTYWRGAGSLLRQSSYEECLNECLRINIKEEYCPCNRLFQK